MPIDFTAAANDAVRHAVELNGDATGVILLHVLASSAQNEGDRPGAVDMAKEKLAGFRANCGVAGVQTAQSLVRTGTPFYEILKVAKEEQVDLIVLAVHDSAALAGLGLGHTVERVSRYAPCPVLLVREGAGDHAPRPSRALASSSAAC